MSQPSVVPPQVMDANTMQQMQQQIAPPTAMQQQVSAQPQAANVPRTVVPTAVAPPSVATHQSHSVLADAAPGTVEPNPAHDGRSSIFKL